MALKRVFLLLAICGAALVAGSSLETDPYTDSHGNVVIPDGNTPQEERAGADESIYTVLSDDGPMAGVARPKPNGHGIRTIRGRQYLDRM